MEYKRHLSELLLDRVREPRKFIQVVAGPRQVGKTTLMLQIAEFQNTPVYYCTGDESPVQGAEIWLDAQWEIAKKHIKNKKVGAIFIIDEIHKILNWSAAVKRNWDKDSRDKTPLKVILSGSAQLLVQKGLADSLTGRYESLYASQWSYVEMKSAFGYTPEQFVWFGGYPGGAALIHDEMRWKAYIRESIIRPSISQDILQLTRIDKPALLAQLFELACIYSGQIVSLQKLTGLLQDAGNVTTLANYLELLSASGFVSGIKKYSGKAIMKRASPPKLQVHDNGLMTASLAETMKEAFSDKSLKGRLIESSIGTELIRKCRKSNGSLYYWREANEEIDFVIENGKKLTAIEVKSGKENINYKIIEQFKKLYPSSEFLPISNEFSNSWEQYLELK